MRSPGVGLKKHPANLKPVGSGPFKLVDFQKGRHLILERYDKFFVPGRPYLDRIIFEYIPDPAARMAAFETGAIHVLPYNYVGVGNLRRVERLPFAAITTRGCEAIGPLFLIEINLRKKELSDVRVRRAHALDKNLILKDINLGYGKVADGPIASASPFFNPKLRRYEYSLDRANQLLDEAGYRRGADGTRFKLVLDVVPGTSELLPVITMAGIQLGQVLAGSILVETVFSWPGMGRLAFESILRRDYPLLLGILFFSSLAVIVLNLLTDVAYGLLDPRIRCR